MTEVVFPSICHLFAWLWVKYIWPVQSGMRWRIEVPLRGLPSGVEHQQYPVWLWHCTGRKWPSGWHAGTNMAAAGLSWLWTVFSRAWARASWHLDWLRSKIKREIKSFLSKRQRAWGQMCILCWTLHYKKLSFFFSSIVFLSARSVQSERRLQYNEMVEYFFSQNEVKCCAVQGLDSVVFLLWSGSKQK